MKARTPTAAPAEPRQIRLVITRPPAKAKRQPRPPRTLRIGRFSTGIEQRPDAPDKLRRGSFADGYDAGERLERFPPRRQQTDDPALHQP